MTTLVLLALIVAVAKLWGDVRGLKLRLRALEYEGTAASAPVHHYPTSIPQPAPAPAEAPRATSTAEPLARPPARVVRTVAPESVAPLNDVAPTEAEVVDATIHNPVERDSALSAPVTEPAAMDRSARVTTTSGSAPAGERATRDEINVASGTTATTPPRSFSFEELFGRKLPIWAGGVTLAVCGFLIVKYSIEAGLISPIVRVIGGLLFGSGLIAGAESARQNADRVRDPRVAQALSGAGIATLYASILVATNLYHLIPPLAAFLFMAATTVLAGALSIRFGAPSAVLGLVGGLAAPALVGSGTPNVPLLSAYLALAIGGLATLGRRQRWWWLGVAALAGGFGWGAVLILSGALSLTDSLSIGAFLLLLGVGLPVLLFGGERGALVRLAGTLAATAQLAALVAAGGFALLTWGLFGLLGIAAVWLSRREKALADVPAPALATALLLMGAWPHPSAGDLALVVGGAAAIFGLPAAWRAWRADWRLSDVGSVCALAAAPLTLALLHTDPAEQTATLLALLGAAAAAALAAAGWRVPDRQSDTRFALLTGTAGVLLAIAAAIGLEPWVVAPVWAAIAGTLLLLSGFAHDRRVERLAWAAAATTVAALPVFPITSFAALSRAVGDHHLFNPRLDLLEAVRWLLPALVAVVFALRSRASLGRQIGAAAAVLLGYVAAAQVVPPTLVPLIPAAGVAILGWFRRPAAATVTAGALAVSWAAWPLLTWLALNGGTLLGFWVAASDLPSLTDAATRLVAPAVAAAILLWRHPPTDWRIRTGWLATLALLGTSSVHIAWKQVFAIDTLPRFVAWGLAERLIWEVLIAAAAVALYRRAPLVARAVGLAASAHLAWFTLLLHNPLWTQQAVGSLPILNLLLPVYALAFALLWAAGRLTPPLPSIAERSRGWALMLVVLLFAASELRQLVHGSILSVGRVGQAEDIARSIVAIAVAVGFLLWGIRKGQRDWRIASLIVMLGAVTKVFLFDTSGLDGLLRIASFAALGFSLIGIGWLYSRYLPDDAAVNPVSAASA